MKRKVLSIILACTMLFGAVASTFAVSAAEVDTSLPPSVTQEDMTVAASKIDNLLFSLIDMGSFLNNDTIQMINQDLLQQVPNAIYTFTLDVVPHPFDANPNANSFNDITIENPDWGVEAGNTQSFLTALKKTLRNILVTLGPAVLCDADPDNPPTEPSEILGLPAPLYRFALYPILQDIGVDVPDPAEYSRTVKKAQMDFFATDAYTINFGVILSKQQQASAAIVEGDMNKANQIIAEMRELGAPLAVEADKVMDPMLAPLFDLVEELLAAPVTTLLKYAPGLDAAARAGHLDWLWGLLAPDMTETPNSMVGVLNTVLGMIDINGTKLGITLPEYDFTAWKDLDTTERLTAFMNYAVEVIRAEGNTEAITALIPADMQGLVSSVLELDDNSIKHFLVNYIAYGKLDFGPGETTTAPTDETTTKASGSDDTTAPAETTTGGGTAGGDNSQPDTGDTALAAVAFTTLLAAGACAVLLKKKSSK